MNEMPVAEYKPRSISPVLKLVVGVVLGIASVFTVLYGVASPYVTAEDRPGIVILGALVAIFAWLMIEFWIRSVGLAVQVFADGIVHSQYGKTFTAHWDEIVLVWQAVTKHYTNGIYTGTSHLYTLRKADNTTIRLHDALKDVEQLGNKIQSEVTARRLPRAISDYMSGSPVEFGNLSITQTGITWNKKSVAWSEVSSVTLNKGVLYVNKHGKQWLLIPVASIPNLWVALTLIERIRDTQASSMPPTSRMADRTYTYTNTVEISRGTSS